MKDIRSWDHVKLFGIRFTSLELSLNFSKLRMRQIVEIMTLAIHESINLNKNVINRVFSIGTDESVIAFQECNFHFQIRISIKKIDFVLMVVIAMIRK